MKIESISRSVWMLVFFIQSSLTQEPDLEKTIAEVGSTTSLFCEFDGCDQDFDVVWFFNNVSIADTKEEQPPFDTTKRFFIGLSTLVNDFSLRIVGATLNDTGEYNCKTKMEVNITSVATWYLEVVTNISLVVESESGLPAFPLPDENIALANQIISYFILILVMITMGANITFELIKEVVKKPSGLIIGVCCQFGIMPLIGFCLAHIFNLPPNQAIGAIIIACCPGGTMSNIYTFWVNGDIPLSVCMTTASTIVAVGMMPLCLFIYTRSWISGAAIIPYVDIVLTLVTILLPIAFGMLIKWKFEHFTNIFSKVVSGIALVGITVIVILQVALNSTLYIVYWEPWVIAPLYSICGFTLGFLISGVLGMTRARCYTIGIETGLQNTFLALAVLNLNFSGLQLLEMLIVPGIYGVVSLVEGLILVCCLRAYWNYKEKPQKKSRPADGNRYMKDSISHISRSMGGISGISGVSGISSDTGLVVYENYGFDEKSSQFSYNSPSSHYSYNSQKSAPVVSFDQDDDDDIGVTEQDGPPLTPQMTLRRYMSSDGEEERNHVVLGNMYAMMDEADPYDDDKGGFRERRQPHYDQGIIINPKHLESLQESGAAAGGQKSTYI